MQLIKQPKAGMPSGRRHTVREALPWIGRHLAVVAVALCGLVFVVAPWPLAQKVHAMLHGLCAQRFSHSFLLGGQALPFDARMTGIYGGFLVTFCYLAATDRVRAWGTLSRPVLAVLAIFVLALGIDGTNSTLRDLGLWYPYQPDNRLRLGTGLLTGISLAVLLCYLLATTMWRNGDWGRATVRGVPEVGWLVVLQAPFAAAILSGLGVIYTPVSLWLVIAAVVVFGSMALALLTIGRKRDQSYRSFTELQSPLAVAFALALIAIGSLAGARFLLEWWVGIPPML